MIESSNPLLTLGLPVFNGERFLARALDSLLTQTFKDFEIIISDNCSTDATQEIARHYCELDSRVILCTNSCNIGAAENYNSVARRASGQFFAWVNHDDLWAPAYFERCVTALLENPTAVLSYTKSAKIADDDSLISPLISDLGITATEPYLRLRTFHDHFIRIDRTHDWSAPDIEGIWIPIYGVIRRGPLMQSILIRKFIGSDTVLLEQLSLFGSFYEIDEIFFFKRDHPQRSMRDSVAYDQRIKWFTAKEIGIFLFPRFTTLWCRVRVAYNFEMSRGTRVRCLLEMLGFYARRRHEAKALMKELFINARRGFGYLMGRHQEFPQKW